MGNQYVSIAEFAKLAGVSKQAVYSRLDSQELTNFIQVETSGKRQKKLINTDALSLFNSSKVNQVEQENIQVEQPLEQSISCLQDQLKEKDKTIETLLAQISQLQESNHSLSQSLVDQNKEITRLLDQQQQLQQSQQILYARLQAPAEKESTQTPEDQKKSSFFSRFFK